MDRETFFAMQAELENEDSEDEEVLGSVEWKRRRDERGKEAVRFFQDIKVGYPEQYERAHRLASDARALRANDDKVKDHHAPVRIQPGATTGSVPTKATLNDLGEDTLRTTNLTATRLATTSNRIHSAPAFASSVDVTATEFFTNTASVLDTSQATREDGLRPGDVRYGSAPPLSSSVRDTEPDLPRTPRRSPRFSRQKAQVSPVEAPPASMPEDIEAAEERSFSQATTVTEDLADHVTPTDEPAQSAEIESKERDRNISRKRQRSRSPSGRHRKHRTSPETRPALKQRAIEPISIKPREKQLPSQLARASTEVARGELDIIRPSQRYKEKKKKKKKPNQILKDCIVLFLPIHNYKRLESSKRRITAYEHGATIVKELTDSVTHVVVDDDTADPRGVVIPWTYDRVKQALGLSAADELRETVTLVDLWYFPDCIKRRALIEPGEGCRSDGNNRSGYRIAGHEEWLQGKAAREKSERDSARLDREIDEEGFAHISNLDTSPRKSPNHYGLTPPSEVADSQPSPLKMRAGSRDEYGPTAIEPPYVEHRTPSTPTRLNKAQQRLDPHASEKDDGLKLVRKKKQILVDPKVALSRRGWTDFKERTYGRNGRHQVDMDFDLNSPVEATPEKASPSKYAHLYDQESPSRNLSSPKSRQQRDALDEAIEEASKSSSAHESCDEEGSQESRDHRSAKRRLSGPGSKAWQQSFACMHGGKAGDFEEGPNATVITTLQEMADFYERTKDPWKGPAYRKAIAALRRESIAVTTKEQAQKLSGVGSRLAEKIEEIASTNGLRRLEEAKTDPMGLVLQGFLQVYGAGLSVAHSWYAQGFRTLDDLRTKAQLTRNQQIGVEHYDDFLARISRGEVSQHEAVVKNVLAHISDQLEITVGGSYRRGAATCGDVDFLITSKTNSMSQDALRIVVFEHLIPRLEAEGYVKASLATSSRERGSKWHGAAALPGNDIWRRVDFLIVPWDEWGTALLYFTGNDIFNRSIRLLASKKGMRLNQHGLYKDVILGLDRQKMSTGVLLAGRDEEEIFAMLGVPYRPPEERVIE